MVLGNIRTGSSSSAPATPSVQFPISSHVPQASGSATLPSPPPSAEAGLALELDSSELVYRAFTGDELNGAPVDLAGSIVLQLAEPTSFKHISLVLKAVARIDFLDPLSGKRYHQETPVFTNHSEFLPLCSDSSHTHTLQSGLHQFHFCLKLPPGLPASLRTSNGSGLIYYKLKAVAARPNTFLLKNSSRFETKTFLRVSRSFPAEALEWSQTLDIENTWPGKISYEISLPRKAFVAGETIPISIKFTPLVKGVRVTSLVVTIKEHVTLLAKPGAVPHVENRDVGEYRFEFKTGTSQPPSRSSEPGSRRMGALTSTDLSLLTHRLQAVSVRNESGSTSEHPPGRSEPARSRAVSTGTRSVTEIFDPENPENLSGELEKVVGISLPATTTPTHPIPPVTVTHKLRFSAFISNPDGHTSELRCALPLHVLAAELMAEATLAAGGNGTNALVFGPSGILLPSSQIDGAPIELPSYPEHVRDRLAPIASATNRPALIPAPWSLATTPAGTPLESPSSRRSSISHGYFPTMTRWNDPELARSLETSTEADQASRGRSSHTSSRASSRGPSPSGSHPFLNSMPSSSSLNKYQLRLPKALTRMAQQLSVSSTTGSQSPPAPPKSGLGTRTSSTSSLTHLFAAATHVAHASSSTAPPPSSPPPEAVQQPSNPASPSRNDAPQEGDESGEDVLSRVPSYDVASLGPLGGGSVPISSLVGLPSYEDL
ncbi:hypothetical protein MJO28_012041 [Puccinia striiformis f. sp. tritici]|uniref:Arrestin C-terminal-like domain-containing protein n=3 Tax=Puccinia striiformis f. sp. tritici TaxID=168172 RepID=A0A0L0VJQ4_9BASI|nr:hypothetical protein Pst134EB_023939 [Puccinia striiformis f. sp. tritici]KAI7942014.1 hypothetical protein MJO28_012041 [Puccinia striiformis f. sp. tritici]KNE99497.1 hypothetical protein PSTG_07214 [Puccinia striiformis f. sp. tritici PST-78]